MIVGATRIAAYAARARRDLALAIARAAGETAFGFFNLVSGIAMLFASVLAGLVWELLGARFTFVGGACFGALALLAMLWRGKE